jgi:hypothetical protein
MIAKGAEIIWLSDGPRGTRTRTGIVRAHVPPGRAIKLPKSADPAKLRAKVVNSVHARYLVEVPRRNARSGRRLASQWLAPKAAVLDKIAKVVVVD